MGIAVYNVPLGVENVPVLCILSMYLLLGLGTDGIFVFVNALARSYNEHANEPAAQRAAKAAERLSERVSERHSKRHSELAGDTEEPMDSEPDAKKGDPAHLSEPASNRHSARTSNRPSETATSRISQRASKVPSFAKLQRSEIGSIRGVKLLGGKDQARDALLLESILYAEREAEAARKLAREQKEHTDATLKHVEQGWKRWAARAREHEWMEEEEPAVSGQQGRATMLLSDKSRSSVALLGARALGAQDPTAALPPTRLPVPRRVTSAHAMLAATERTPQPKPPMMVARQLQSQKMLAMATKFGASLRKVITKDSDWASVANALPSRRSHRDGAEEQGSARESYSREAPPASRRKRQPVFSETGIAVKTPTDAKLHDAWHDDQTDDGVNEDPRRGQSIVEPTEIGHTSNELAGESARISSNELAEVSARILRTGVMLLSNAVQATQATIQESPNEGLPMDPPSQATPPPSPPGKEHGVHEEEELRWIVRSRDVPATPRNLAQLHELLADGTITLDTQLFCTQEMPLSTLRDHLSVAVEEAPEVPDEAIQATPPAAADLPRYETLAASRSTSHSPWLFLSPAASQSAPENSETGRVRRRRWRRAGRGVATTAAATRIELSHPKLDPEVEANIVARGLAEGSGVLTLTLTTTTVCFAAGIDSPLTVIRQFSLMQTLIMLAYCVLSMSLLHAMQACLPLWTPVLHLSHALDAR